MTAPDPSPSAGHTPGPLGFERGAWFERDACGCTLGRSMTRLNAPYHIVRCAKHAAAPSLLQENARLREALRESERLAAKLIGTHYSDCGGRHFAGRECAYCLVDDVLKTARAALAQEGEAKP